MSNGKIRREVLIGVLLLAIGFLGCVVAYFSVRVQVDSLDLTRLDVRASINNLEALLIVLSVACLLLGALGGYLIGKYRHL
jgi:NAD/NADP transhydrogenase beta subunit